MPRRRSMHSVEEKQRIAQGVGKEIVPHGPKLSVRARRIFDVIITRRARADWDPFDIYLASKLARIECQQDLAIEALAKSKDKLDKGLLDAVAKVSSTVATLRRQLGMHSTSSYKQRLNEGRYRKGAEQERTLTGTAPDGEGTAEEPDPRLRLIKG